jgi:hypothetical protein
MGERKRWRRIRSPAAAGARETKPSNDATSDPGRRFTLSLGEISALTATVGGLTYLLGLFVFALPIRRVYPMDFSAAWHATSLVPKTVVAGQGVTGMLGLPLLFGAGFFAYFALWDLVNSNYQTVGTLWRPGAKVFLILTALSPVVMFVMVWLGSGSLLKGALWLIALLLVVLVTLRGMLRQRNQNLKFEFFSHVGRDVFLPTLIIVLLIQFALQAVTVAQESDPPLPRVEITWSTDTSDSTKATLTEGKLLTHTESIWYVLKKDGQDAGLTAIPDDEVQHVRIGPPAKKQHRE